MSTTPYKEELKPYEQRDAIFFFGREKEREKIVDRFMISRLMILYGKGGIGKTSLLQAGVANYLKAFADKNRQDPKVGFPKVAVVIFKDWNEKNLLESLLAKIKESINEVMNWKRKEMDKKLEKEEHRYRTNNQEFGFIQKLEFFAQEIHGELFIILDQFESYFLDTREEFDREFIHAVNYSYLPIHFLVSIRSEYMYKLDAHFGGEIVDQKKSLELQPLTEESARDAIIRPIERYNFIQYLENSRLTILPGKRKIGKSFMLQAGIIPYRTKSSDSLPNTIYFNTWSDTPLKTLVEQIKDTIKSILPKKEENNFSEITTLKDVLEIWEHNLDKQHERRKLNNYKILIIFDQLEKCFNYSLQERGDTEFAKEFCEVIFNDNLPVNFLISIDEDRLQNLKDLISQFKPTTNEIHWEYESLRLLKGVEKSKIEYLSYQSIAKVIIENEEKFVETILEGISENGRRESQIAAPYLQLIMTKLWKLAKLEKRQTILKTPTKESVKEIEKDYIDKSINYLERKLEKKLNKKFHPNFKLMPRICFYLCSPSGGKRSICVQDILNSSLEDTGQLKLTEFLPKLDEEIVTTVVEELNKKRILQTVEQQEKSSYYEVYFERLIPAIQSWRTKHREQIASILYHRVLPSQSLAQLRRNQWDLAALLAYQAYECYQDYTKYLEKCPIDLSEVHEALQEILESSRLRSCPLALKKEKNLLDFWQIRFNPLGESLAASNKNGSIGLWNIDLTQANLFKNNKEKDRSARIIKKAHDPKDLLKGSYLDIAVVFSPDGTILFSGARDGKIKLWDVYDFNKFQQNPIEEYTVKNSEENLEAVTSLAFNQEKNLLAAGTWEGNIWLWNLTPERKLKYITSFPSSANQNIQQQLLKNQDTKTWIWSVAINPEGNLLAFGGNDKLLYLWDIANHTSPKPLLELKEHTDEIFSVAFSPDGKWLASGSRDCRVLLWNLSQFHQPKLDTIERKHKEGVRAIAFDSNSQKLASAGEDQTIKVWDLENPKLEPDVLHGHSYGVCSVAFDPKDSQRLVSCSWDRTIRFWNLKAESEPKIFEQPQKDKVIQAINLSKKTSSVTQVLKKRYKPDVDAIAAIFIDEQKFAIGYADGTVLLRNINQMSDSAPEFIRSSKNRNKISLENTKVSAIAFFHQDGLLKKVALSSSNDSTIWIWNLLNPSENIIKDAGFKVNSLAFCSDGKRLALGSNEGKKTVKIWNLEQSQEELEFLEYERPVTSVAFKPNSDKGYLAVASTISQKYNRGEIKLWDLNSPNREPALATFEKTTGNVSPVVIAFSPDGKQLAEGSDNSYIKLFKIEVELGLLTLTEYKDLPKNTDTLPNRNYWITSLAFSQDSQWLASGRYDGSIQLWDLKNPDNKPIVLQGHEERIKAIAFSPDGKYLVSASSDNTVRLWTVKTEELANRLKDKLYRDITDLTDKEKQQFLPFFDNAE